MKKSTLKSDEKAQTEFVWPEFNSDRERIKFYTKKYESYTIAEALADVVGKKIKVTDPDVNVTPHTYKVGDIISTRIMSISKNHVTFGGINLKSNLISNTNLYRFEKFKHYIPTDPISVKVVDVKKDRVIVDPLSPIMDKWITEILSDVKSQNDILNPKTIRVKNLQLTTGGFNGRAVIPALSEFVGEEYTVDAFIPGSQIVLNITDNFEQFVGKDVDAFVTNYIPKPGAVGVMSLVCSVKEYLKLQGDLNLIEMFKSWCEDGKLWKDQLNKTYAGEVTGVINTSKRCGIFVEVPEMKTTGMIKTKPEELVNYKPHDKISIKLTKFDEDVFFNDISGQMVHNDPYVIENNILRKCNIKPVFEFA